MCFFSVFSSKECYRNDVMPGNKNSGRKKVPDSDVGNGDAGNGDAEKRRVGRPRKKETDASAGTNIQHHCEEESESVCPESNNKSTRTKQNIIDLSKRNSLLNDFYTEFLGASIEIFPSSKLPLNRSVLQRYRALRSISHNTSKTEIVGTITNEVLQLWDNSSITHDTYRSSCKVVQSLVTKWVDATQEQRKSYQFQSELNKLLDIRPRSLQTLSALKSHLQASGNSSWLRDYEFFKGQCTFPQTGTMSHTVDGVMQKKVKEKARRTTKSQSFAARNAGDFSDGTHTVVSTETLRSTTSDVVEENILPCAPRQASASARDKLCELVTTGVEEKVEVNDAEWELPPREYRRLRKRPDTITLTLPAQKLPSVLAKTSVVTKTSARHELKILSTVIKSGGGDINNTVLYVHVVLK